MQDSRARTVETDGRTITWTLGRYQACPPQGVAVNGRPILEGGLTTARYLPGPHPTARVHDLI
ncbi:MAG: hypothetical protein M3281_03565, partial [Chloroflexota bacterium]|nr:hypothetical protein [Chloroflexota bacterium]